MRVRVHIETPIINASIFKNITIDPLKLNERMHVYLKASFYK